MLHTTLTIILTLSTPLINDSIAQECKDKVESHYNQLIKENPDLSIDNFKAFVIESNKALNNCIKVENDRDKTNRYLVRVISSRLKQSRIKVV